MNNSLLFFKNATQFVCAFLIFAVLLPASVTSFYAEGFSLIFSLYFSFLVILFFVFVILEIEKTNCSNGCCGSLNLPPEEGMNPPVKLDVSHPKKYFVVL
ncbi:MAG: hypothetical protein WC435_02265 [Candidatus Paceibacterota bacterium]